MFVDGKGRPRQGLKESEDYVVVKLGVWNYFLEWYGASNEIIFNIYKGIFPQLKFFGVNVEELVAVIPPTIDVSNPISTLQ